MIIMTIDQNDDNYHHHQMMHCWVAFVAQATTNALVGSDSDSCIFVIVFILSCIFVSFSYLILHFCIFFVFYTLHCWLCRASHHSCSSGISLRLLLIPQKTPHDDDDDIYIMMQCVFVTKNHHFLLGVSCNRLNYP